MLRIFSSSFEQTNLDGRNITLKSWPFSPPKYSALRSSIATSTPRHSPFILAGKGLQISGSCTSSGTACAWWEMFEEGNWSELDHPLIRIQKKNSAPLTMEIWAFRVFAV